MHDENIFEQNIVTYICGFLINRLQKDKSYCQDCISLSKTSTITDKHVLVICREFKPESLVRVSEPVTQLCELYEQHFKSSSLSPVCTRQNLISSFIKKVDIHQFALNCPNDHIVSHVNEILSHYSIVRIFFTWNILIDQWKKIKKVLNSIKIGNWTCK